ncbi:MAG: hypothetical protein IKI97_11870, partial [Clostridia bacterium]|nr:hypothetical protein [Clostridia bacterium]
MIKFGTEEARIITEAVKAEPEYESILKRLEMFSAAGEKYPGAGQNRPALGFLHQLQNQSGVLLLGQEEARADD